MHRSRKTRSGFSLVEMIAVIGIITVLLGIIVVAYNAIAGASAVQATKTTLAAAQSMLAELNTGTRLTTYPPKWYWNSSVTDTTPNHIGTTGEDFWNIPFTPSAALSNPGDVSAGGTVTSNRFVSDAIRNTQLAMKMITSIPANKSAFQKLPTDLVMRNASGTALDPPVLLDAWQNPIIFVPATGLTSVTVGGVSTTITTTGTAGSVVNRPFFASAGPDGDFSKGDDNVYSFGK